MSLKCHFHYVAFVDVLAFDENVRLKISLIEKHALTETYRASVERKKKYVQTQATQEKRKRFNPTCSKNINIQVEISVCQFDQRRFFTSDVRGRERKIARLHKNFESTHHFANDPIGSS